MGRNRKRSAPSVEWDLAEKRTAWLFSNDMSLQVRSYFSYAVKYANEKHGETPQDFWRKLFIADKGQHPIRQIGRDGDPRRCPPKPYSLMDFQALCKYLRYGQERELGADKDDSQYFYDEFKPASDYRKSLDQAIKLRNKTWGHPNMQKEEDYSLSELESEFELLEKLTECMARKPAKEWLPQNAKLEPVNVYFKSKSAEMQRRFGVNPIPLKELGQALFAEDVLSTEQEELVNKLAESMRLIVRDGKVWEEPDKDLLITQMSGLLPWVKYGPISEEQLKAVTEQQGQQEQALKELEEMKEATSPEESPKCPPLPFQSAQALRGADEPLPLYRIQQTILTDFILLVDETMFLSKSGRPILNNLLSVMEQMGKKLSIDQSVTAAIFRQFRQSKPYTDLELSEMEQDEAEEMKRYRAQLHTEAKTAIKLLGQFREHGCLEVVTSPTSSRYSYDNINYLTRCYPTQRFFVLTMDAQLAEELRDRNVVVAKPFLHKAKLLVFHSTKAALEAMLVDKDESMPVPIAEKRVTVPSKGQLSPVSQSDSKDELLPITAEPLPGQLLVAEGRSGFSKDIRLGKFIAKGGEGSIYLTSLPNTVAKIYSRQHLTRSRKEKLTHMISANPNIPRLCWPSEMIYTTTGEWLGFLMPKAEGFELATTVFTPGRGNRNLTALGWTRANIVIVAANIAAGFDKMHEKGILMGDINPRNFMLDKDCNVYFVDCDSYQFDGFGCPVFSDLFLPAEVHRKVQKSGGSYTSFVRTKENELYSLAVLLFQTLMLGKAPFESRTTNNDDLIQAIIDGDFPYRFNADAKEDSDIDEDVEVKQNPRSKMRPPVGQWRFIWSNLPYKIKENFYNTFTGKTRPTAEQWVKDLWDYHRLIANGYSTDELSPTKYKANVKRPDKAPVEMVNLVCRRCGNEFNLAKDVYNARKNTPNYGFCETCLAEKANFRKRKKLVVCSSCKNTFEDSVQHWLEISDRGLPILCESCRNARTRR